MAKKPQKKLKHAFTRLKELPAEAVAQVEQKLLTGTTCSAVATWMHDELGVFKDIKHASLKKNLERYRASDLKDKVIDDLTKGKDKNIGLVKKRLSALDEIERLVEIQKGRLEKALLKEAQLPGMLTKQATDESRLLKEMLVELGKIQLETGVLKRAPKTVSGSVFDPQTGETKQYQWTEEQDALFKQLDGVDYTVQDAQPLPAA